MHARDITIRVVTEDDGAMWATVEEMPGVFAAGDDLEAVRESVVEAIALYLADDDGDLPQVRLGALHSASTRTHAELVCV